MLDIFKNILHCIRGSSWIFFMRIIIFWFIMRETWICVTLSPWHIPSLCVVFEFAGNWVLNLTFAVILPLFYFFFWGTYCTYRGWGFEGAELWQWLIVCVFTDSSVSAGTVEQQLMFMYEPESINNLTRELILKLGRSPAYVMALNEKVIFCRFYVLYCLNSHILTLFEINIHPPPPPNLFLFTFLSGFEGLYTCIRHQSVVQYATHKQ